MATIDYKQKIKDYMNSSEVDTLYKSMLNNLFPELRESEDERIRKEIIAILQYKYEKYSNDPKYSNAPRWIAWLKKQGGQNVDNRQQYISKAAVLAEIERLVNNYDKALDYEAALEDVRDFLDSIEVKDVNLEKEFNDFLDNVDGVPPMWHSDEQIEWAKDIARHFYELGLQAQKEVEPQVKESAEIQHVKETCKENGNSLTLDGVITFDYYERDKAYGCVAHDSFCYEDLGLKDRDEVKILILKK